MCYLMLMETAAAPDPFVASLPVFAKFESVADIDNYRPLPE
ncbi:adenylate cyclase, partial [Mesorhizobium sp. M2A.F.Ca.ET.042.01.1.1]